MEKINEFVQVFASIGALASKECNTTKDNEARSTASIVCYGLDALNEFAGNNDHRTSFLMKCIRDKFDPKDKFGAEIYQFMDSITELIIQSNRFVWEFGKISTIIKEYEKNIK